MELDDATLRYLGALGFGCLAVVSYSLHAYELSALFSTFAGLYFPASYTLNTIKKVVI